LISADPLTTANNNSHMDINKLQITNLEMK